MNYSILNLETTNTVVSTYYRLKFHKGFTFEPHLHPRLEIMLVVSGDVTFYVHGKNSSEPLEKERLTSSQYIFFDSATAHGFYCNEESTILNLEFNYSNEPFKGIQVASFIQPLFSNCPTLLREVVKKGYIINYDQYSLQSCMDQIMNLLETLENPNASASKELTYMYIAKLQEFFTILCYNATHLHPSNITYINRANEFIMKNYLKDISTEDIAKFVGINKFYLEKLYKTHIGQTIGYSLTTLRIDMAKKLLVSTNYSISDIARKSGFNIRQQLIYNFKKRMGVTPSQYATSRKNTIVNSPISTSIKEQTYGYYGFTSVKGNDNESFPYVHDDESKKQ